MARSSRLKVCLATFTRMQEFAALHGSIHNHVNSKRTFVSRPIFKDRQTAALAEWRLLCAA